MSTTGVAVVTGGGRGIGAATARRLAGDGYTVIAAARTESDLARLAERTPGVVAVVADIGTEHGVDAVAAAADAAGTLHAWINNAAVLESVPLEDMDVAAWDRTMAVNLRGAFLCCRAALARMRASGGGVIVNIGSLSGLAHVEKFPGLAAYNASKAGLAALSEMIALEGRASGIRSVTLSPGAVDTEMLRRAAPHLVAGTTPDEVAAIIAFLVSDAAAPLSGTTVPLFTNR